MTKNAVFHQRIIKNDHGVLKKTWAQLFNIDDKKKYFNYQISILEWFLNDHVILKTGEMYA